MSEPHKHPGTCFPGSHLCWLEENDPRYRAKWHGELVPPVGFREPGKGKRLEPCVYIGAQNGETDCQSCRGRVVLKLFECSHPDQPLGAAVCAKHGCGPRCKGYKPA